ncbi:MAG: hypothetical protein Q9166_007844 [cf. Caloplaca sp. 2 TL-2023]
MNLPPSVTLRRARYQGPFGAIVAFLASFAITTQVHPTTAGHGLAPRGIASDVGLGVELGVGRNSLENNARDWTPEDRENLKGAELIPIDFLGNPKTKWVLETGGPGITLIPEAIVDGTKNMVGERQTKGIGEEIFQFFSHWSPCRAKECKVNIKGFDKFNPWIVKWPKDEPLDPAKLGFGPQVTTAMPLEGLLEILRDTKDKKENPLASKFTRNGDKITILKKDDFKPFDKIKSEDITDEFLGYFSLLTSYCVVAKYNDPKKGPKRSLPIMPRTDFVAQYVQFVEKKLEAQFCDGKTSLYGIVQKVSGRDDKLAGEKFSWTPGIRREIDEEWKGMEDDLKVGTLGVEKFLNYIQGYDKKTHERLDQMDLVKLMDRLMRHGQIGSLNDKMESGLGTDRHAAIFEFRELVQVLGDGLSSTMESYENKVIDYHNKAPKKRSIHIREESHGNCKSKIKKPKCPPGQLVAMIKNAPKKNQKGDECEPDCPVGQVLKATRDGCEACGKGEKPNVKGDKCEVGDDDQIKCADGEAKSGPDGKCEACPKDKKPTVGGDQCEPKTEEDKKKDKEMKDKNKSVKNAGFCLGFVGVALGGIEGLDFASDEGAALINSEAEDIANDWPKDVEFKDMDLGNSNIEPAVAKTVGIEMETRKRSIEANPFTPIFKVDSSKPPTIFFWLIPAIIKGVAGIARGAVRTGSSAALKSANEAVKTGKAFKNTKPEASNPAKISSQVGKNTKVPSKPAKFGEKIKMIKDNKSFKDCLALAAVSYVGDMAFHVGTNIPEGGSKPEEKALVLTVFTEEDNKGGDESTVQTYNDDFYHPDRLEPGRCSNFDDPFENSITGYDVALGCCKFYKDAGCKNSIFAATNREHADLQDDANNSISSFACTFDMGCKNLP